MSLMICKLNFKNLKFINLRLRKEVVLWRIYFYLMLIQKSF